MRIKIIVATVVLFIGVASITPAFAQYVGGNPPTAGNSGEPAAGKTVAPASVQVSGQAGQAPARRSGGLAFAGADIMQLVLVGGAFVVVGVLLTMRRRRGSEPALS